MRLNKKKIIATSIATLSVGTLIYSGITYKHNQNCINIVKNGKSKINEDINYQQAWEKYLDHCNWITYKDSEGNRLVSIKGKRFLKDKNRIADVELTYIVNEDNNTFKFYKGFIDKLEMNQVDALIYTIQAMDTYDAVSNY